MASETFVLETPRVGGALLRVLFQWRTDRFGHAIDFVRDDVSIPLLQSLEGTPADDWPPSPALQQLHVETRSGHPIGLLVGMAGKNYWSMSVELHPETRSVAFDVACRVNARPGQPRSSYRASQHDGSKIIAGEVICGDESGACRLIVDQDSAASCAALQMSPEGLIIVPAGEDSTVRWKYCVTPVVPGEHR